MIVDSTVVLNL